LPAGNGKDDGDDPSLQPDGGSLDDAPNSMADSSLSPFQSAMAELGVELPNADAAHPPVGAEALHEAATASEDAPSDRGTVGP
jgi:hypothetical protein